MRNPLVAYYLGAQVAGPAAALQLGREPEVAMAANELWNAVRADWMVFLLVLSAACTERPSTDRPNPCLDRATRRAVSPSLQRTASANTSSCGGALAPQVTVEFKTPEGTGGPGVFAVSDSAADINVHWRAEDTLEIIYPARTNVIKQDTIARFYNERVRIVYVTTGGT